MRKFLAILFMLPAFLMRADLTSDASGYTTYVSIIGDSISMGYPEYASSLDGGPSGDTNYNLAAVLNLKSGDTVTATNLGVGARTFADLVSTDLDIALLSAPRFVFIHCGVNDLNNGRTWANVLSDLNSINATCINSNAFLLVDEIFPWSNGSDAQSLTLRTWNTNIFQWCQTNANAHFLESHDTFGTNRVSTGQLDDLSPTYDNDGVHVNATAYDVWGQLLYDGLTAIMGNQASATWYVDSQATGNGSGTNWVSAWLDFGDIVWGSIDPGDTITVAGGVYDEGAFSVGASGTPGSEITIEVSQDVDRNGVVLLSGYGFNMLSISNVIWDGRLDQSFTNPTNWYQVTNGLMAITNNIGIIVSNSTVGVYTDEGQMDNIYRYMGFVDITNNTPLGDSDAFSFANGDGDHETFTIEYCWIYNTGGDAVHASGSSIATEYKLKEIKFCWFYDFGDDGFEINNGFSIHDSVIGPAYQKAGHQDFVQGIGDYNEIYNCAWLQGGLNSYWRIQFGYGPGLPIENYGPGRYYNNVFYGELVTDANYVSPLNPIEFVATNPQLTETNHYLSYILFANNTFYNYTNDSSTVFAWTMSFGASGGNMTNTWILGSRFLNNIILEGNKGVGFNWVSDTNFPPYGQHYTSDDLELDYNIVTGTNFTPAHMSGLKNMGYRGTTYASGEALAAGESWQNNTTNYPAFVDHENYDLELSISDTVALNQGTNLSSVFDYDTWNRPRNAGGAWDIGAFENQEADGLVVFLSFDSVGVGEDVTDDSGNGYTAVRFENSGDENSYPTNRAVADIGGTTFRPNATGNAAEFLWRTNLTYNPTYLDIGGFYGITNAYLVLSNMNTFTVMCWARYNAASRTDRIGADSSDDNYATLLSGGSFANSDPGSWHLGRYGQVSWLNNTRFIIQTNGSSTGSFGAVSDPVFGSAGKVIWNFPDRGTDNDGDTTNWYHYAFTFTNGLGISYFNGQPYGTNDVSANVTTLMLGQGPSNRAYDWVGVGVFTHVGTPEFDDETGTDYPNNGWMNGGIDQVRIYSRALSYQEIIDVANSEGAEFADAPSGSSPTYAPTTSGRFGGRSRGRF